MAISKNASETVDRVGLAYQMDEIDITTLIVGGTNVTSTAAELNIMDTVTATAAEINLAADHSANTEDVTANNVITAAESGTTFFLNSTTGRVHTLPTAALGLRYTFIIGVAPNTTTNHTIISGAGAAGTDIIFGTVDFTTTVPGDAEDTISFVATTTKQGDRVDLICDGTNWYCTASMLASGAITFTTAES